MMEPLTQCASWLALHEQKKKMAATSLNALFAHDADRATRFNLSVANLYLDYSKNHIDAETQNLLVQLAQERNVSQQINALFNGEIVNQSEKMPSLHTALRDVKNPMPTVKSVWNKMKLLIQQIQQGKYLGYSGKPIRDVVNIGVGGSHWGPLLLYTAFKAYASRVRCHFISNLDEEAFLSVVRYLNPETTLFIATSKSFATEEMLENFKRAKRWLISAASQENLIKNQLLAVTAEAEKARALGFSDEQIFLTLSYMGGRYSVWSAVGLSAAIALGWDCFYEFLSGAYAMDQHFRQAELSKNMPVLLALLSIWYINFFDIGSQGIIPYSQCLSPLPGYLQQLHMESLGKSHQQDGRPVDYPTEVVTFGDAGTDSQHSFHQLFLQGTAKVHIDFILPCKNPKSNHYQWRMMANCLGQSKTFMQGYTAEQIHRDLQTQGLDEKTIAFLTPHKVIPGNVATNTILMDQLTPASLGALLALYEHKVFVQSVIWNIDAFDQGGVDRGKKLARALLRSLETRQIDPAFDASTQALLKRINSLSNSK